MVSTLKVQNIAHTDGTTGLTIDSAGRVSQPARPSWLLVGIPANNTSSGNPIIFGEASFNPGTQSQTNGGCTYNNTNGQMTIPKTGLYHIDVHLMSRIDANEEVNVYLQGSTDNFATSYNHAGSASTAGGRIMLQYNGGFTSSGWQNLHYGGLLNLNANEKIRIYVTLTGGTLEHTTNDNDGGMWSGYYIG
tara:strand:+ start:1134 stop:1706 length:573 start_codon:yes stop_codon:yes gene_type:complete